MAEKIAEIAGQQQAARYRDRRRQQGVSRRVAAIPTIPVTPPLPPTPLAYFFTQSDIIGNYSIVVVDSLQPRLRVVEYPLPVLLLTGV